MNVYGPRQDYQGAYIAVIMKMLDAIDQGRGADDPGRRHRKLSISLRSRIARSANLCAMKADATDRFYNVGTGKRTSLKEVAEKLSESDRLQSADQLCAAQPGDVGAQPDRLAEARQEEIGFAAHRPRRRAAAADRLAPHA